LISSIFHLHEIAAKVGWRLPFFIMPQPKARVVLLLVG